MLLPWLCASILHLYHTGEPFLLQDTEMILERFSFCPNIEKCLAEIRKNTKLAVGLSRQHALNNPRIHRSDTVCFPQASNIYTYSVLMQARQDFYLLPHINDIIGRAVEHGLVVNWMEKSQNYTSIRLIVGSTGPNPLTVNHVLGAIVVMAAGLGLAILSFAVEVFLVPKVEGRGRRLFKRNVLSESWHSGTTNTKVTMVKAFPRNR